jgi:Predicted membrane protein
MTKNDQQTRARCLRLGLDRLAHDSPTIFIAAFRSFNAARATEAAAAIAYYTFFSFFPLLLILMAVGSVFLDVESIQQQVLTFVGETVLPAQDLVRENIQQVLELRRPVGIVAAVGLLWAATGVFTVLARNINRAWQDTGNFLEWRLAGLAIVGGGSGHSGGGFWPDCCFSLSYPRFSSAWWVSSSYSSWALSPSTTLTPGKSCPG